jgi:putative Mg2+ transporter-C (MgtC) family protein
MLLDMDDLSLIKFLFPIILYSIICGSILGIEREINNKKAGIKTNILICIGSALFTVCSILITKEVGDPSRVISQIVSGIGFLGAGTIIRYNDKVSGLTSAAIIWVASALGIMIGLGYGLTASITTFLIVIILMLVRFFERRYIYQRKDD